MITVVIPVGPHEANKRWLDEAINSCLENISYCEEILIIDDSQSDLRNSDWFHEYRYQHLFSMYTMPWRTGISHAFNYGVALARNDLVFMLGSDDTLEPTCLEQCYKAYEKTNKRDGYYSVPIRYMDTGEVQTAPCNAAMTTKGFWRYTGGFPVESAIGMGDSIFLSICLAHKLPVYWVGYLVNDEETPLYNYRRHPDIHTYKIGKYFGILDQLRDILTRDWEPHVDSTGGSK